jgi:hypothetical protein
LCSREDFVFQLLFDARHTVLMSRFHGTYVEADICVRDKAVARFVARHGLARGIMDFSAVEAVDVPLDYILKRAQAPPVLPGQARVIVASREPAYSINRIVAAHQLYSRKVEPLLVGTLEEAYRALAITDPAFEPLENDAAAELETIALGVVAAIDRACAASGDDRWRMRQNMLRLLDTALTGKPAARQTSGGTTITLSDVLNAVLRRVTLSDGDLAANCARCRLTTPLIACRVEAGRKTTYACPNCRGILLTLASAAAASAEPARGYLLGSFLVCTEVDIECPGGLLPRSRL